jgi:type IV secretion system protein VirB10
VKLFNRWKTGTSPPETEAASEAEASGEESVARVEGERGESAVQRPPSLQSRVSNYLAMGFMSALALGLLGWYFASTVGDRMEARAAAQSTTKDKAKGEMVLQPLGRVDPPTPVLASVLGEAPEEPPPEGIPEAWLRPAEEAPPPVNVGYGPPAAAPKDLVLERKLAGAAFAQNSGAVSAEPNVARQNPGEGGGELSDLLRPTATRTVMPERLATETLMLPKGAFLDCTLETAIDSSLAGMTTCVLATDSFSADGSVVLLERGTKLIGETRGQVRAGSARVFVLWTEARTPHGVIVPLDSPGTDELGRSGLSGKVNYHFFQRFGAAILMSVIDGAVQAAVQSHNEGGDSVNVNPSSSSQVMTEVLKSTMAIPPTVVKPQGDRIQILVARNVDFRSVYELRAVASKR